MWEYSNKWLSVDPTKLKDTSDIIKEIRELRAKGARIGIIEAGRLQELEKKLFEMQSQCEHSWITVLLFIRHRKFCKWCDKEDFEYRHKD